MGAQYSRGRCPRHRYGPSGLINVGQLVREQHGRDEVTLVGFGSYTGSVIAGSRWGAPMREMDVPDAIPHSFEAMLHEGEPANKLLILDEDPELTDALSGRESHRAIGVVYNPDRERGNYVPSRISDRYDAFLFIDETQALHPLRLHPEGKLTPETYPFGI